MVSTIDVLRDRAGHKKNVFAVPSEILDIRGVDEPLSLGACKTLALMIGQIGPLVIDDVVHTCPVSNLDFGHRGAAGVVDAIRELQRCVVSCVVDGEIRVELSGSVVTDVAREINGFENQIAWRHSDAFRKTVLTSQTWGLLSADCILAMDSRYALRLYQWACVRVGRRQMCETVPLDQLRRMLDVPSTSYPRWADFVRYVLQRAVDEVNFLTPISLEWEPVTERRRISGVKITWWSKDPSWAEAAREEIERGRGDRPARRLAAVTAQQIERADLARQIETELLGIGGFRS